MEGGTRPVFIVAEGENSYVISKNLLDLLWEDEKKDRSEISRQPGGRVKMQSSKWRKKRLQVQKKSIGRKERLCHTVKMRKHDVSDWRPQRDSLTK